VSLKDEDVVDESELAQRGDASIKILAQHVSWIGLIL
jgi:hypothetical protein